MFWVLLGFFLSTSVIGYDRADPLAEFNSDMNQLDLTPYIMVLTDAEHSLTIEQLASGSLFSRFRPLSETGNSLGFSDATYWIKFQLKTNEALNESLVLHYDYPYLDQLTFYRKRPDGSYSEDSFGDNYPFSQREINYRSLVLKLYQTPGEVQTYYLKLNTKGAMLIPVSIWKTSAFIEHVDKFALSYGFYYGIMMILMLVSAIAYYKLSDFLYLSYSLYLLNLILLQMSINGFGFQFLWPDLYYLANRINILVINFVVITGFLFCGLFLQVWRRKGRFKYLYNFFILVGVINVLISLVGEYSIAVILSAGVAVFLAPVVIGSNLVAMYRGYKGAGMFLMVSGIFLLGVIIAGMVFMGWVERNFFTFHSMQIASLFEIVILGYMLMDNLGELYKEKEQATLDAKTYLEQINLSLEQEVESRTRELNEKNRMLMELSIRDSMSGLLNHNYCIDQLKNLTSSAIRYGHDLAVIMIDIDHFKSINDQYGHPVGDNVIKEIAEILKTSTRAPDRCGRYGGEEFILLLPQTNEQGAVELAEQIRRSIMGIQIEQIDNLQISASFGVTCFDHERQHADLISIADEALYCAKRNGRNQVVASSSMSDI
jgi:two-component system, sensor histidine kinase LadS